MLHDILAWWTHPLSLTLEASTKPVQLHSCSESPLRFTSTESPKPIAENPWGTQHRGSVACPRGTCVAFQTENAIGQVTIIEEGPGGSIVWISAR